MRLTTQFKKIIRIVRRHVRALKRPRNQKKAAIVLGIAAIATITISSMQHHINRAAYQPLLTVIAKGESQGNYNAYFGHAANTDVRFTAMTIQEVLDWQKEYIAQGAASNAVGRYQFMGTTLQGLIREQGISPSERFDEDMQDRLAIALINRRGAEKFVNNKITAEQFATNLSMEWAALPRLTGPNVGQSYYAGDGLNAAHITPTEMQAAIDTFRAAAIK